MSRWNKYASSTATEDFLKVAAKAEGLSYHAFCDKYGIVDNAAAVAIRRHEVPLYETDTDEMRKKCP